MGMILQVTVINGGMYRELILLGGFNPFEKYWSKWESAPNRAENKIYLKPPPRISIVFLVTFWRESSQQLD